MQLRITIICCWLMQGLSEHSKTSTGSKVYLGRLTIFWMPSEKRTRWERVKQYFKDQGGDVSSMPLQVVKDAAMRFLTDLASSGM